MEFGRDFEKINKKEQSFKHRHAGPQKKYLNTCKYSPVCCVWNKVNGRIGETQTGCWKEIGDGGRERERREREERVREQQLNHSSRQI